MDHLDRASRCPGNIAKTMHLGGDSLQYLFAALEGSLLPDAITVISPEARGPHRPTPAHRAVRCRRRRASWPAPPCEQRQHGGAGDDDGGRRHRRHRSIRTEQDGFRLSGVDDEVMTAAASLAPSAGVWQGIPPSLAPNRSSTSGRTSTRTGNPPAEEWAAP